MVDLLLAVANVTAISWVKLSSFGRHKTKNNWYTMFFITGCAALQHSTYIFSAKPAYIKRPWINSLLVTY